MEHQLQVAHLAPFCLGALSMGKRDVSLDSPRLAEGEIAQYQVDKVKRPASGEKLPNFARRCSAQRREQWRQSGVPQ